MLGIPDTVRGCRTPNQEVSCDVLAVEEGVRMERTLGASAVGVTMVLGGLGSAVASESPTCFDRSATIVGTDGDDRLRGTDGPDVIVAGGGADVIRGFGGDDVICAGKNPWLPIDPDEIDDDYEPGYDWSDRVYAGPGDDTVDGGPSLNHIHGGTGDDVLYAGGRREPPRVQWRLGSPGLRCSSWACC
jgi:hypothetical protein